MKAFVETGVFGYQEMLDFLDLYKIDYGHLSKKQKNRKIIIRVRQYIYKLYRK